MTKPLTRYLHQTLLVTILLMASLWAHADAPRLILNQNDSSTCLLGDEVRIDAATGDLHVAVANLNECLPTGGTVPPAPTLTVTPTLISPGGSVSVSWSSENAGTCVAGGNFPPWSGSKAVTGTQSLGATSTLTDGTYQLTITCSNSQGASPVAEATVQVQTVTSAECTGTRAPPPGLVRTRDCLLSPQTGDCTEFTGMFGEYPPDPGIALFSVEQGTYVALRIDPMTIPPNAAASIATDVLQNPNSGYTAGPMLFSFSTCPGDFTGDGVAGCVGSVPDNQIRWGGSDLQTNRFACALQSNQTYYLNFLFTNQAPGTPNSSLTWFCAGARCGMQMQGSNVVNW